MADAINPKAKYLSYLIEQNAFATSASALAKALGYKGKVQMYRILEGTAGDGTIEEVWQRIRQTYELSDDDVCLYAHVLSSSKAFWKEVKEVAKKENLDEKTLAEEMLHALLLMDTAKIRRVMSQAEWDDLLDLSREHPFQYAQYVTLYYIHYNNINSAYKGDLNQVARDILEALYDQMQRLKPENRMIKDIADVYRSEIEQMEGQGNLLTNTHRATWLVQSFTDQNFRINTLSKLRMLPIPEVSLWLTHDDLPRLSANAFLFFEYIPDGATGGRYDCVEVEAQQTDTNLVVKRCFLLSMAEPDEGDEYSVACIQFLEEGGKKQVVYYDCEYDEERQNLHLEPMDSDNPNSVVIPFPKELHWVNPQHPIIEDEKLWIDWYEDFFEKNELDIIKAMLKSEGMAVKEDYDVEDVSIGRKYLIVSINHDDTMEEYRVSLKDHPGLKGIQPDMDVLIMEHEDDGELYLEWISPHIVIALKEMEKMTNEESNDGQIDA